MNGLNAQAREQIADGRQLGRIEAAMKGVRLNTDSIDNSAGVDSSDHEVNIKILVDTVMAAGGLTQAKRNALLASMTAVFMP